MSRGGLFAAVSGYKGHKLEQNSPGFVANVRRSASPDESSAAKDILTF